MQCPNCGCEIQYLDCPNCGVGCAIPIAEEVKPKDFVQCNICYAEYTVEYLKAKIKKSRKTSSYRNN